MTTKKHVLYIPDEKCYLAYDSGKQQFYNVLDIKKAVIFQITYEDELDFAIDHHKVELSNHLKLMYNKHYMQRGMLKSSLVVEVNEDLVRVVSKVNKTYPIKFEEFIDE